MNEARLGKLHHELRLRKEADKAALADLQSSLDKSRSVIQKTIDDCARSEASIASISSENTELQKEIEKKSKQIKALDAKITNPPLKFGKPKK